MNTQNKEYRQLRPRDGLIIFVIVIVSMIVVGTPIQLYFGLYGVAATELIFAVIAIAAARILRADFKEAFPFAPPPARAFVGGLIMYMGAYPMMLVVIETTDYLFPSSIGEIADSFVSIGTSLSPISTLIIMAVMPAICEELLHRGIILSSLKGFKREWVTVLVAGLIFGLFHLDPFRLLSTAILGALFAYIALRTNSMLIGMILHFLTNAVSVYAIFSLADEGLNQDALSAAESVTVYTPQILISEWLINAAIAAVLLLIGNSLLTGKKPKTKTAVIVAVASAISIAAGFAIKLIK